MDGDQRNVATEQYEVFLVSLANAIVYPRANLENKKKLITALILTTVTHQ